MNSFLCDLIKKDKNWERKIKQLDIKVKYQDNLVLFKYSMDANFNNPIVQEARGIIIDLNTLEVVCWPFRKFGNYGESYADSIDWTSARVQEKIDGSIIKVWFYNKEWRVSTNGEIDADNNDYGKIFRSLFDKFDLLDKDYTYIFELVSPFKQIIVPYQKNDIYHLGTRNNKTGEEVRIDIGVQKPKEYELYSLEDCIEFANTFSAKEHEGFVVVDSNWNRIKVKSPDYIRAHYLCNNHNMSVGRLLAVIRDKEEEELLNYFPCYASSIQDIKEKQKEEMNRINNYCDDIAKKKFDKYYYAINYKDDKYFHFCIEKVYKNKELDFYKYWKEFFKDYEVAVV